MKTKSHVSRENETNKNGHTKISPSSTSSPCQKLFSIHVQNTLLEYVAHLYRRIDACKSISLNQISTRIQKRRQRPQCLLRVNKSLFRVIGPRQTYRNTLYFIIITQWSDVGCLALISIYGRKTSFNTGAKKILTIYHLRIMQEWFSKHTDKQTMITNN